MSLAGLKNGSILKTACWVRLNTGTSLTGLKNGHGTILQAMEEYRRVEQMTAILQYYQCNLLMLLKRLPNYSTSTDRQNRLKNMQKLPGTLLKQFMKNAGMNRMATLLTHLTKKNSACMHRYLVS